MKILTQPSSGSIGGVTYTRSRGGQAVRSRVMPRQSATSATQIQARSSLATVASAWHSITPQQRSAWQAYGENYPVTDALGQKHTLSGFNEFVKINTVLFTLIDTINDDPPPNNDVYPVGFVSLVVTHPAVVNVGTAGNGSALDLCVIGVSGPKSPGQSHAPSCPFAALIPGDGVGPTPCATAVIARFGTLRVGRKYFAKVTPVSQYGVSGVPAIVSAICA